MPRIGISDVDDPRLAVYRDLPQSNLTRGSGLFVAEGEKVVIRLLESRFEVASVLAEPECADRLESRLAADVPVYVAPKPLLQEIVGFHFHRGVLACGKRQPRLEVDDLIESRPPPNPLPKGEGGTIVVLPDVQDPTNLGSIIRTAAAFGCQAVVLGRKCADPFSRRVLRVSMGAALHLPIVESRDLADDLKLLAASGFEVVATVLDPSAEALAEYQRNQRTAILFGSEGHGLSDEWAALCARRVTIPMQVGIDSLNVAIATAVVLWQVCRSRLTDAT
jgi:tRNA G18 (ribose-2'-O)-methylase SpoU